MIGAHTSGYSAHVFARILAAELPRFLAVMPPTVRAEVAGSYAEMRQAAEFFDSVRDAERGNRCGCAGGAGGPLSHEVDVAEAMEMLGLGERQVRNYAGAWQSDGFARKVGGSWLMHRAVVEDLAESRRRRNG